MKSDGTVWAWGYNPNGQIGNGNPAVTTIWTPVQVGGLSDILGISAGASHSLVFKSDGTFCGFGRGSYGQLGSEATANNFSPVVVNGIGLIP